MSKADRPADLRTDIQGLRAIAVSLVVAYHLAPKALTGGFVGVDVFFVISGFLITSHLLVQGPRRPRDLARFWSRRVRRLLPASLLVLGVTLVASRIFAPDTQWANTARQARAAGLYVVNWSLARDSVDYLAAHDAPSPVQHFWSLSVEEQFYFVWPILILLLLLLARRTRRSEAVLVSSGLTLVVVASLAYSIHETAASPASAYFVTPTRIWELGIGGLLATALAPRIFGRGEAPRAPRPMASALLAWAGIAAMAWSAWRYTGSTPFPGWQALVPVLGAALVIAAHPTPGNRLSPGALLALRPVQWLGDVSYSVYLWHWPMVVLVPYVSGGRIGNLDRLVIVVTTLVLAGLTKKLVEDRFRTASWGIPLRKPFLLAAAGMAVVVGLAGVQLAEVAHDGNLAKVALQRALAGSATCFGARSFDQAGNCPAVPFDKVVPAPADAAMDKADAYADVSGGKDCWSYTPSFPTITCERGDLSSNVDIALVGNSHGGQWLPAIERLAKKHHWRITTYLASQCALAETSQSFDPASDSKACSAWAKRTATAVARAHPDLVVMSNRISVPATGKDIAGSQTPYRKGYSAVLRIWQRAGLNVLVLRDTPAPGIDIPDCLATHSSHPAACNGTRASWLPHEPAQAAVRDLGDHDIDYLDLTDHICRPRICAAITGGVTTYFDNSHLTATYATTLAPYLDPSIQRLLGH